MNTSKALTLLILALGLASGCGGGGGDGVSTTECIDFVASAGSENLQLQKAAAASTCTRVAVDLVVQNVNDLYEVNFTLLYNASVADFSSASEQGSFLASGGAAVDVQQEEKTPGVVEIGLTRRETPSDCDGVSASGTPQRIVRLFFDKLPAVDTGQTTFAWDDEEARNGQCPPLVISGITWSTGMLVIR